MLWIRQNQASVVSLIRLLTVIKAKIPMGSPQRFNHPVRERWLTHNRLQPRLDTLVKIQFSHRVGTSYSDQECFRNQKYDLLLCFIKFYIDSPRFLDKQRWPIYSPWIQITLKLE